MEPRRRILDVKVPRQAQDNWCWAAVSVGIRRAYEGSATRQCEVAERILSIPCCPAGTKKGANVQRPLAPALRPYLKRPVLQDPRSRSFEFVKEQIDRGHPIAVRLAWRDGGGAGHFVVISGYHEHDGIQDVFVCDPYLGGRGIAYPYEQFRNNYHQLGAWDLTYRTEPKDGSSVPECSHGHLCL